MRRVAVLALLGCVGLLGAQAPVRDMGRLGTWYRSSAEAPDIESDREAPMAARLRFPVGLGAGGPRSYGAFQSVQVNVDSAGRNIIGDAANEPSMAIDPTNPNRIAIGWRQFNSVLSNFRQGGYGYSTDAGKTWTFPGVLESGVFRSDPVLDVDRTGRMFYNSLEQTFYTDIWRSASGGNSWSFVGEATGGDKQWMTIDRTAGPGMGHMYQAWSTAGNNYGGRQFSRSVDGVNWEEPQFIPNRPIWGTLDVAPNGDLFIVGLADPFRIVRSTNAKNALATTSFDLSVPVELGGSIIYASYLNPVGLSGQVYLGIDKSNGPNAGNLYMLCSVGVDETNPCDVNFVRSTDGGVTWSAPVRVNDDPRGRSAWHWFGTMSVAPNGRIDACWYDTRANPGTAVSALYFSSSFDGGRTWTPNQQVSDTFSSLIGFPQQDKIGDYIAMVSDNSGASIAYAATFNGEQDVWFLRVPIVLENRASALRLVQGRAMVGDVTNTWDLDGQSATVSAAALPPMGQVGSVEATSPLLNRFPSQIRLELWGRTSQRPTTATVWFYHWARRRYEAGGSFAMPLGTGKMEVRTPGPAASYISTAGEVRISLRAFNMLRTRPPSMTFSLDKLAVVTD